MEDNIYNIKKEKKTKKKPSETINTGSYYNKANRLIIIYAFGQFQTTVAYISKWIKWPNKTPKKSPNFTLLFDNKILKTNLFFNI